MTRKSWLASLLAVLTVSAPAPGESQTVWVSQEPAPKGATAQAAPADYRIGPDDLLSIAVLEAGDLSRSVRVSANGEISLPLIGVFRVAGMTPRAVELLLEGRLKETYMRDPHVSVQVEEMQSHPVSVLGAVNKPGTYQIRGTRTLLEVLSLAEGPAENAGDTVVVMRLAAQAAVRPEGAATKPEGESPATAPAVSPTDEAAHEQFVEVKLKDLITAKDPAQNILIYPGDIVKVTPAGMVYIVGEVNRPGSFPMSEHEKLTVLRAVALGQGLKPTAAKKDAMIIRTTELGARVEIPVNLENILKGKTADIALQERDVMFVPNSASKSFFRGAADALVRMVTLRTVVLGP